MGSLCGEILGYTALFNPQFLAAIISEVETLTLSHSPQAYAVSPPGSKKPEKIGLVCERLLTSNATVATTANHGIGLQVELRLCRALASDTETQQVCVGDD
jgi:hypothetical protein